MSVDTVIDHPISSEPTLYKTATISRLTGYSPLVLRAWERRHGILQPVRTQSGHRLYTEDDLRVLQRARELTARGLSIGEVAAMGRTALLARGDGPMAALQPALGPSRATPLEPRTVSEIRARLVRAAATLDDQAVRTEIDEAFALLGEERLIREVVGPALHEVGGMWAAGQISVAAEKVLSLAVRQRLLAFLERMSGRPRRTGGVTICTCVGDEQHDLGALALALALARSGYATLYLGPSLPLADLDAACRLRSPRAVCFSFKQAEALAPLRRDLHRLAEAHPQVLFLVGGDGVTKKDEAAPANLVCLPGVSADETLRILASTIERSAAAPQVL